MEFFGWKNWISWTRLLFWNSCVFQVRVGFFLFVLSCRATTILGYLPQELLGTSCYEYFHQDDLPHLAERHRKGRACCQSSLKKMFSVNMMPYSVQIHPRIPALVHEDISLLSNVLVLYELYLVKSILFYSLCVSSFSISCMFCIENKRWKHKSKLISLSPSTVLRTKEKIETNCYKFKTKYGSFVTLQSQWFSFINPWTKEVEYIVSTNTVIS